MISFLLVTFGQGILFAGLSLLICMLAATAYSQQPSGKPRTIEVDGKSVAGPLSTAFKRCVGAGRANEGLRADWQQQLKRAKSACGFEYIRMHGLLCDDMGVYFEDSQGTPTYNWQYIDALYDFLVSIKVRPFVEFGFMPGALASGSKTIFWWRGNVTPPKDYGKWASLIEALVRHWIQRYGLEEVAKWYFEVWNEPNLDGFWAGDQAEYFKLYETTARAVKRVSKRLRVGGPATAGNAWIPELIQFCASGGVPLDFVSTHTYGVDVGFLDEFGGRGTVLSRNSDSIIGDVRRSREQIKSSPMPDLPLFYTEWSSSYTPADPFHDSYVSAAYILEKLNPTIGLAEAMSYWTFTDIFEEAGPRATPFHGGFGFMNLQGIEKPAFRAYEFLNRLGSTRLKCSDAQAIATKDDKNGVQIVFWDFTNTIPDKVNNQDYFIRDIRPNPKPPVRLSLSSLLPGTYEIEVYRVGYRSNDPYSDFLDLGRPSQLTLDQVRVIQKNNSGTALRKMRATVRGGRPLVLEYEMRENDAYLVTVKRIG